MVGSWLVSCSKTTRPTGMVLLLVWSCTYFVGIVALLGGLGTMFLLLICSCPSTYLLPALLLVLIRFRVRLL